MKKFKAILALILVAALFVTLFAACANNEQTNTNNDQQNTNTNTDSNTNTNQDTNDTGNNNAADNSDADVDPGEIVELVMYYYDFRSKVDYSQHVEDAVNEILMPEIGVKLDIKWLGIGNWLNTFNLDMAGGEQLDIINIMPATTLEGMYSNNQLVDLTDLLPEYAPQTYELMADYFDVFKVDGRIYGIPTNKNFRVDGYIVMNKAMLEEIGMLEEGQNLSSWSEYEAILAKVYEHYNGDVFGTVSNFTNPSWLMNGDSFADIRCNDFLGAQYYVATDDNGNVSLLQATEGYKQSIEMSKRYLDNGWLDPDLVLGQNQSTELMKAGKGFSYNVTAEYGVEVAQGGNLGFEVVCAKTFDGVIRTNNVNSWGAGVTVNTENEIMAVKTLEYIYNSAEVMNILNWGVEGVDYEIDDEGLVARKGTDVYFQHDAFFGNNLLMTPLAGTSPDFYEIAQKINNESVKSPYLGFAVNSTGLENILAQLSAVYDQYHNTVTCGYYTEELYQEYLDKLEVAGVYDYLDAIQTQLDAWLAANK